MRGVCLVGVVAVGLIVGCGSQDPPSDAGAAGSGSGGVAGTTGMAGGGGFVGAGGQPGGAPGAPGITASTRSTDAGPSADGGSAPTFTQLYSSILSVYCGGGACHNPGSQKGISFASQSSAYSAVSSRVIPGDGEGSSFFYTVNSGNMPLGGPKLSAANLAMIRAWIDAGALDD